MSFPKSDLPKFLDLVKDYVAKSDAHFFSPIISKIDYESSVLLRILGDLFREGILKALDSMAKGTWDQDTEVYLNQAMKAKARYSEVDVASTAKLTRLLTKMLNASATKTGTAKVQAYLKSGDFKQLLKFVSLFVASLEARHATLKVKADDTFIYKTFPVIMKKLGWKPTKISVYVNVGGLAPLE